MNVDTVLRNDAAFDFLARGAHPCEFCDIAEISLDQHFDYIETNSIYRGKFMCAMTKCLSVWHAYADSVLMSLCKEKDIGFVQVDKNESDKKAFSSKYWEVKIKDLERYLPVISLLEPNVSDSSNEISITLSKEVDLRNNEINK